MGFLKIRQQKTGHRKNKIRKSSTLVTLCFPISHCVLQEPHMIDDRGDISSAVIQNVHTHLQNGCVRQVEGESGVLDELPALLGLTMALLGQRNVLPSREAVLRVPDALTVPIVFFSQQRSACFRHQLFHRDVGKSLGYGSALIGIPAAPRGSKGPRIQLTP